MTRQDPSIKDTVVYYVYDDEDRVIYVGKTNSFGLRMGNHERRSRWWGKHTRIETAGPFTADEALRFEWTEIGRLAPVFNDRGPSWRVTDPAAIAKYQPSADEMSIMRAAMVTLPKAASL